MKLTTGAKFAILLVVLALAFFGIRKFGPGLATTTTTTASVSTPADTARTYSGANVQAVANVVNTTTPEGFGKKFTYFPDQPENGSLRGVIEFGASGFNAFAVEIDKARRWKLVTKAFDESHALEGEASDAIVVSQIKKYIDDLKAHGVSGKNIQFVMSSGAKMNPNTYKVKATLSHLGYVVNEVSARQEGELSLLATQPQSYSDKSFVVDIGSGNTKITYKKNGQLISQESFGAKYAEKGISDATVTADITAKIANVPQELRGTCFIIGGVPFKLANEVREGQERYTTLAAPEKYDGKGDKKRISGLNIYKAIIGSSGTKTVVFDWDSNFTIGYLISKVK